MPRRPLLLRAVRALFLARQHLLRPRAVALDRWRLERFAQDVGGVQLDSIHVVERAHYLTLWSRFGAYDRGWLDRAVYQRRILFEYWAHAACLVPARAFPWWRRAMLDYHLRHTGWSKWLQRNPKTVAQVREAVRANGPLGTSDFREQRPAGAAGWWRWGDAQHALHYLWMTGELAIHSRRHFHKRYDLLERVLLAAAACEPVCAEEFARWHVERSLHAMGAATERDLGGYLTFPRAMATARRQALRGMLERGEVVELDISDAPGRWLALARDLPALARAGREDGAAQGTTFLSPFDSLIWYRDRAKRLFGFDYRIEVYTPGAKRVHGYYTMPILHRGELIGRLDAKAHRAQQRLEVRHVHLEEWFAARSAPPTGEEPLDQGEGLAGIAEALRSLAEFVAGPELTLGRVTPPRLHSALARAMGVSVSGTPRPQTRAQASLRVRTP